MIQGPLIELPENLPVPEDDGACRHLLGQRLPNVSLPDTSGASINLSQLPGITVLYAYPLTGRPGMALPPAWLSIPGAPGCTLESCGFRDHHAEIRQLGAQVFGLSTQTTDFQREARERLHLPFELLSDESLAFTDALSLPTFTPDSVRLLKRLTLICHSGSIEHVFYPVFPPDTHSADVISYLTNRNT
jgi:peroxiredoxin